MSRPRIHTAHALALALLATSALASRAIAAQPIAVWLDGHDAVKLRGAVAAALPAEYTIVTVSGKREPRKSPAARLSTLVERAGAHAGLYVRVEARTRQLDLIVVRSGADPVERRIASRALKPTLADLLRAPSAPPTTAAATATPTPSAPTPPPSRAAERHAATTRVHEAPHATESRATESHATESRATESPSPTSPAASVARAAEPLPAGPLFSLALDGGVTARRLTYNQALTQNLPTYSVAAVPWLGFRAALYPFARTGVAVLRDLGALGSFGHSLYQRSIVAGSTNQVSATWSTFDVGLRERISFRTASAWLSPTLGIALAYGRDAYSFDDNGIQLSETPSVDYRYIRPAVDGRIALGRITFFADFGYRAVLSAGYVAGRFPHASVGGLDVGAGLSIALPRDFELRLIGRYARFFYDLKPEPGDPYVAGGALDEYGVGELALAYGF